MEWLRHAPHSTSAQAEGAAQAGTPAPVLRLRHLLNMLKNNPEYGARVERVFADAAGARRHAQSALLDFQLHCQRHNKAGLDEIGSVRSNIDTWNGDATREYEVVYDDRMPALIIILDRV